MGAFAPVPQLRQVTAEEAFGLVPKPKAKPKGFSLFPVDKETGQIVLPRSAKPSPTVPPQIAQPPATSSPSPTSEPTTEELSQDLLSPGPHSQPHPSQAPTTPRLPRADFPSQESATSTTSATSTGTSSNLQRPQRPHGKTKAGDRGALTRGITKGWQFFREEKASGYARHRYMTKLLFLHTVEEKATTLQAAHQEGFTRVKDKSQDLTDDEKESIKEALVDLFANGWTGQGFRGNVAEWISQHWLHGTRSSVQITGYMREVIREVASLGPPEEPPTPDEAVLQAAQVAQDVDNAQFAAEHAGDEEEEEDDDEDITIDPFFAEDY